MRDDDIWEARATVVELGLAYGVRRGPDRITITMPLTTPEYPLQRRLPDGVRRALAGPDGPAVDIDLVWDPAWSPERLGESGRRVSGGPPAGR